MQYEVTLHVITQHEITVDADSESEAGILAADVLSLSVSYAFSSIEVMDSRAIK